MTAVTSTYWNYTDLKINNSNRKGGRRRMMALLIDKLIFCVRGRVDKKKVLKKKTNTNTKSKKDLTCYC